ncbi:hypothetical protein [Kribbella deserti]|uniref:Lipoprotein n=1 Tax=Kribbella deserti TaxID=1926257 RepID=A0ABV6QWP0_9ACTN
MPASASSSVSIAPDDAATTKPAGKPALVTPPMAQLSAAQVVTALTGAGYTCGKDSTYAICESGPVAVWVLTGKHKRVPVVSLHSIGKMAEAHAAIEKALPKALQTAHVNEVWLVADWFAKQAGKTAAKTTIGDWKVELYAEADSEEPGVHLTLTDKFCTANCQAE